MTSCRPLSQYVQDGGFVLDVAASRRIDRLAIDGGWASGWELMHAAGNRCAERIHHEIAGAASNELPLCVIFCGVGNNGGDGMVIAKRLVQIGVEVRVFGPSAERFAGDAATALREMTHAGIELDDRGKADEWLAQCDREVLVVDAMLGTGAKGDPRPPMDRWINAANAIRSGRSDSAVRVAIDVPSGLDADLGIANDPTFRADLTLTFVTSKVGFHQPSAGPFFGRVEVVDIGIPERVVRQVAGAD